MINFEHYEGKPNRKEKELVKALELALKVAESWIHDQLDGTSSLADSLKELEPARKTLEKFQKKGK